MNYTRLNREGDAQRERKKNCHVTWRIGIGLRRVERCSIDRTRLIESRGAVTCQGAWADEQWGKDICSGITLWVKRGGKLIVRLKAIKSRENIFCYLSSYLPCSFLWHLVIVTFIYCIIKPPMPRLLYRIETFACIVAPLDHPQAIDSSRPWVVAVRPWSVGASSRCAIRSLSSSRATLVIVSLSECSVSVPNLILSEYLVDDGCVHLSSVNFSYRQARQSASLMTDACIRRRSTSPIDEPITC